jgi:hypothetical protein
MNPMLIKYSIIGSLSLFIGVFTWYQLKPDSIPIENSVELPLAKEIRTVETIKETVKVVHVYPKTVKPKLNLPSSVIADDNSKVTASSKLKTPTRDYTITSVIDTDSGKSTIYARPDPLPLFGTVYDGEASISYGIKNGNQVARLSANQNLLRIKAVGFGVSGSLDSDGSYFTGVSASYKW